MRELTSEETRTIISELKVLSDIAEGLYSEIGNESTIELHERLKNLKKFLNMPEWP